jgi:hypothetical protein
MTVLFDSTNFDVSREVLLPQGHATNVACLSILHKRELGDQAGKLNR